MRFNGRTFLACVAQSDVGILFEKMRMSHIYQLVKIKHMLRNHGLTSDSEIAKDISLQDPNQIEYNQNIISNMVGNLLHNIDFMEKKSRS